MELEGVIKKLEFKDDINKLSEEELLQKYASSVENGLYFLHELDNLFVKKNGYPVMIYGEFDKVENVVKGIKEKYANGNNFELVANRILRAIKRERIFIPNNEYREELYSQIFYLKQIDLGSYFANDHYEYEDMIEILLDKTKELNELQKGEFGFPNKNDYGLILNNAFLVGINHKKEAEEMIQRTYERYPFLNLCHKKEVLYAINHLFESNDFDDYHELVNLAKNVVDFSMTFYPYGNEDGYNEAEYAKIAKKTMSHVKKFSKLLKLDKTEEKQKVKTR